jgi:hypothetical protein
MELAIGCFIMFCTYLVYKAVCALLFWLFDNIPFLGNIARVLGVIVLAKAGQQVYNRSRRKSQW